MPSKETKVAIRDEGKETLHERLRTLIGKRSARAAAKDWGLSFSTLNNYLNRGTEPSFSVVTRIAGVEGVPLEWLAFGGDMSSIANGRATNSEDMNSKHTSTEGVDATKLAWLMVYESLAPEDIEALLRMIHKKGVDGILNTKATNTANDFLQLSDDERQRVLRLAKQIKEGASEDDQENEVTHPTHKQAG